MRAKLGILLITFAVGVVAMPVSATSQGGMNFDGSSGTADPVSGVLTSYQASNVGGQSQVWDQHNFPGGAWEARADFVNLQGHVSTAAVVCVEIEEVISGCTQGLNIGGGDSFVFVRYSNVSGSHKAIVTLRPTFGSGVGTASIKMLSLRVCRGTCPAI